MKTTKLNVTVKAVADRGNGAAARTKTKVFLGGGFTGIAKADADKLVAGILADLGTTARATFSRNCGCSSCPCSPGWNVKLPKGVFDVFVEAV